MLAKKGIRHELVRGVIDRSTGDFLPYPLPVTQIEAMNDDMCDVKLGLDLDDPSAWSCRDRRPLALEFKLRVFVADHPSELTRYLLRRADVLGIQPAELPAAATLEESAAEERAVMKARLAVHEAMWYAALRWSNLEETPSPSGLRVPRMVRLPKSPALWPLPSGEVPVASVIPSDDARFEARKSLGGAALSAFNEYCRLWDKAHR